jgi:hypothetical protein
VLIQSATRADLQAQASRVSRTFEPSGDESFHASVCAVEIVYGGFAENLWPDDEFPCGSERKPAPGRGAEHEFVAHGTVREARHLQWAELKPNLGRV